MNTSDKPTIETSAEMAAGVKVARHLAWHLPGCVKRYGAQSDEPCECERRAMKGGEPPSPTTR